jgi:hypothetical protein
MNVGKLIRFLVIWLLRFKNYRKILVVFDEFSKNWALRVVAVQGVAGVGWGVFSINFLVIAIRIV